VESGQEVMGVSLSPIDKQKCVKREFYSEITEWVYLLFLFWVQGEKVICDAKN
jgi:hypothetical protein